MDEPTSALVGARDRRSLRHHRATEEARLRDPVHLAQVRRDFPHRRSLDLPARRRGGRRRAHRRASTQADLVSLMVGRAVDQVYPTREAKWGEVVLEADDLSQRHRVRRRFVHAARRPDHRLLRPRRRRPVGSDAGPVRPWRDHARIGQDRRQAGRHPFSQRRDRRRSRLCPRGSPDPGRGAGVRHPRQHDARFARRPRPSRLHLLRQGTGDDAQVRRAACRSRRPIGSRSSANCRAAISRRW